MEFGVFDHLDRSGQPLAEFYEDRLKIVESYDRAGIWGYHVAEHHSTPLGLAPSPSVYLGAVARATERLHFGPLVYPLPLYHPIRLIEEICMLDHLSRGRLQLGVGRGISPIESRYYGQYGQNPEESPRKFAEALDLLLAGLTRPTLDFHGEFYQFSNVPMELAPLQQPHPPIWLGVHSPASAEAAGRRGFNVISLDKADDTRVLVERYRAGWEAAGGARAAMPKVGMSRFIVISETGEDAVNAARRAYPRWFASFNHLYRLHGRGPVLGERPATFDTARAAGVAFAGTPRQVLDALEAQVAASGINYLVGQFAFGDLTFAEVRRSIELFARNVIGTERVRRERPVFRPARGRAKDGRIKDWKGSMGRMIRHKSLASRREFLTGTAAAGLSLATGLAAPPILAQTRAPLRLGVLNTFSGASASTGDWNWNGINVYLEHVHSTFAGRKVELIKEDDQFSPQVGLQKARKFVESDKVDMIVGIQGSNIALALVNYIKESKAFLLISGAGTDAITWERLPYMFRSSISSWQLCHPFAEWIYDTLGKEMAVISEDYAGGHDVAAEIITPFKAKGGKILKEIYVPIDTTDYNAYLTVLRSVDPPVVYDFSTGGSHCIRFVQQYAQSGIKAPLTGFAGLTDATTVEAQGKAALGVITSTIYSDTLETAENRQFVAAYRAKTKEYPNLFADYGYVSMQVIDAALQATDGDTSNKDKLAEAMAKVSFNAPRGPFRFDPVTHNPIQNVYICKEEEKAGRIVGSVIGTRHDVQAPGTKST